MDGPAEPIHDCRRRSPLGSGRLSPDPSRSDPPTAAWATPSTLAAPSHGPRRCYRHPPPWPHLAPGSSPATTRSGPTAIIRRVMGLGGAAANLRHRRASPPNLAAGEAGGGKKRGPARRRGEGAAGAPSSRETEKRVGWKESGRRVELVGELC